MADPKGFLKYTRELPKKRPVAERVKDWRELYIDFPKEKTHRQAARCMDCGIPFCHSGCPLGNIIPEFNDAVYRSNWRAAVELLLSTNNFPEFTGRICPAPCEAACVLGINQPPVTIEHIEKTIAEEAFTRGYIRPRPPVWRTGKKVAVVGSGPAGLAAAAQLNKAGHLITVFERADRVGGLLRYGIPDFKLEKWVVERRIALMEAEGVRFRTRAWVGKNVDVQELLEQFDAIVLAGGCTVARDLQVPGRQLKGIYFAMDYLTQQNRRMAGDPIPENQSISAKDKDVIVIGGGDTGADCVGTANRQGARSVTQLEILPMPPKQRPPDSWPEWPRILRTSTSHEEGCQREWSVNTVAFVGDAQGHVQHLVLEEVEWVRDEHSGRFSFQPKKGTRRELPCQLALIAAGFVHPEHKGMLEQLGVALDARGNVLAENYHTSVEKVFAAGDMRRGQSLVVHAIAEGREVARAVDQWLMGDTILEARDEGRLRLPA